MDEKELKKELDDTIGDSQQQLLIDVLEEIKRTNLITPKEKQEELQRLYEKVSKMTETKGDKLIEAVNDLAKITKGIKLEFPDEFKVKVLNQLKFPDEIKISNPTKFPDEIKLKKPDWYKQANQQDIIDSLEELISAVKENKKPDLETYREPRKALAVRLVNRKGTDFYEAVMGAIGSMGASSFPFENASKTAKAALVDAQGHVQVDVLTGGGSETTPSTLVAFITDIPTAGSRVQLATNTIIAGIIEAPSTNTGNVYIGGSNVSSTVFGAELQPGQSAGIAISNTNKLWVDVATSGDDVAFFGS